MNTRLALAALAALAAALAACTPETPQPAITAAASAPKPRTDLAFSDDGANAKLAYGIAGNPILAMECEHGGRVVHISYRTAPDIPRARLMLWSKGARTELNAEPQVVEDRSLVFADAPAETPVFAAFRRSGELGLSYGASRTPLLAGPEGRAAMQRFFTACERA